MLKVIVKKYGMVLILSLIIYILFLGSLSITNPLYISNKQIIIYLIALSMGLIIRSLDDMFDYHIDVKQNKIVIPYFVSNIIFLFSNLVLFISLYFLNKNILLLILGSLFILFIISINKINLSLIKIFILPIIVLILSIIEIIVFKYQLNFYLFFYLIFVTCLSIMFYLRKKGNNAKIHNGQ